MPGYFLDTSALGKHYHLEVGTADVDAIFQRQGAQIYISRLAFVEFRSAFAGKVRTNQVTQAGYQHVCTLFETDIARQIIKGIRFSDSDFQQATLLIEKHALTQNLRTLDALQLAIALSAFRQGIIDFFVCADKALCSIAQAEGLSIINPVP
ncbi:MAG TPA: type II toxin-antitoxin system VapC family toxin [Blastocatellia bacterium]|nr:type II toxin-antitoxin system VapC family toxin [Blastocatellia bacterium]HMV83205.1 type II toxin-antitoxin system VapC family toxin [Blastocatellia bacterium]HMX26437.1 type II toxin-antitoxin system VapC family toxin [Blastocatellia bacterium]HMY75757.1 type II toxin-antitoxin system VapC family toxin [Blastocatellia bacterium]HMZ22000.1 type II toxin-antitoxin system VapC family toxin [Blastocatellia bacterium]